MINHQPITRLSRLFFITFVLTVISGFLFSCSTQKNVIQWNVELKESDLPITNRCDPNQKLTSLKTPEQPKLLPATEDREARVRVLGLPCKGNEEAPVYEIPVNRIKRITYVSDPLQPPVEISTYDLMIKETCCRNRTGWWIFDKFELKLALGYRGNKDSVAYPAPGGQLIYRSSFFGFKRGGSSMVIGLEAAGLWNLNFIDKTHHFQGGILLGLWPVDESLFVPVGLDLRYTFNQFPGASDNCNSWYLYGNAGIPFDFNTGAPVFGKKWDFQRFFYGVGIGYDWAINCKLDFSLDFGYRYMNLPLPQYDCCPTVPSGDKYPFRKSDVLLLRFGLTF